MRDEKELAAAIDALPEARKTSNFALLLRGVDIKRIGYVWKYRVKSLPNPS